VQRFVEGIRKIAVIVRVERDRVPTPVNARQQRIVLSVDSQSAAQHGRISCAAQSRLLLQF